MVARPILASALTSALTSALLAALAALLPGCPPAYEQAPCFPAQSSSVTDDAEGGFDRRVLGWEIDKLPALPDAPEMDVPPSPLLLRAQRDMKTEFWLDAAKGLMSVVRGDTRDGRKAREVAEFDLGIALFRLRYYGEAKRIFMLVAADKAHPMQRQADEWMTRQACGG